MSRPGPTATAARHQESLRGAGPLLFGAAIFASAFLLFLVQPMVGKRIIPWFGGSPAVWTLCLAFYQSMLFLGYAYAHCLIRFARPTLQLGLHSVAVAAAFAALPVLPSAAWVPEDATTPITRILAMLAANVALPFLVLASTGPLVQAWFVRCYPRHSPYRLYAVSNVGSLLALLVYPFLFEPRLSLSKTGGLWSTAFVITAIAVLGCAARARRAEREVPTEGSAGGEPGNMPSGVGSQEFFKVGLWIGLAGSAVVVLMGITNKLCLDVASVPFLWIVPLATYLSTFILCFTSERLYSRWWSVVVALFTLLPTVGQSLLKAWLDPGTIEVIESIHLQIALHCVLLFSLCMIMHGELYRLRPPPQALTIFYLCGSGGGALGGLLVGILAPVIFNEYYEFEMGLTLVALLFLAAWANDPASLLRTHAPRWRWGVVGVLALSVLGWAGWMGTHRSDQLEYRERSFFGVHRVARGEGGPDGVRTLTHGTTRHGVQFIGESARRLPTAYYGRATGVGLVLTRGGAARPRRVGVVGLGIGTLAAYGRTGETIRFYEIDPVVVRIARDEAYFHYLEDSLARIEIVAGDARLSLAHEQERGTLQNFDYLIVDAFSSDAVPVHLLTREAFGHYSRALADDGLLMVHVTNRHLDLAPLVARMGLELQFESLQVWTDTSPRYQSQMAGWIILSRDASRIRELHEYLAWGYRKLGLPAASLWIKRTQLEDVQGIPIWTDDFSDPLSLLKPVWQ